MSRNDLSCGPGARAGKAIHYIRGPDQHIPGSGNCLQKAVHTAVQHGLIAKTNKPPATLLKSQIRHNEPRRARTELFPPYSKI